MIRILHTSDVHIGAGYVHGTEGVDGLNTRLGDYEKNLNFIVDKAILFGVDLFLFGGDGFKSSSPSPTEQMVWKRIVERLKAASIPVVMVVGNHDLANAVAKATALDIFHEVRANVFVSRRPEILTVTARDGRVIEVLTIPYFTRAHMSTLYPEATLEEINEKMATGAADILHGLIARSTASVVRIAAAHITVSGHVLPNGTEILSQSDPIVALEELANPELQYVALGHIHKYQNLTEGREGVPPVIYPGSPERVDFGEEHEPKGFCLVTIDDANQVSVERIATPARRFVTIQVDLTDEPSGTLFAPDPQERLLQAIRKRQDLKDAVVRVKYRIRDEQRPEVNVAALKLAIMAAGAFNVADSAFIADVVETTHHHDETYAQDLDPRQAAAHYFETHAEFRERKEPLMLLMGQLMEEVDHATIAA